MVVVNGVVMVGRMVKWLCTQRKKILGVIPQEYLSQDRRSNWSQDEGYVPYTKRQLKDRDPDTKIQKDELYLEE